MPWATQLALASCVTHLMAMSTDDIYSRNTGRTRGTGSRNAGGATSRVAEARGPIIDQDGREIPAEALGP